MNNKLFIAVSVLLALAVSLIPQGTSSEPALPDSVAMSDTALPPAVGDTMSKPEIMSEIENILTLWHNGGTSAQMAIIQLEKWTDNEDKDILAAALDGISRITVETDAKVLFDDAQKCFDSGDHISAIKNILDIDPSFSGWSECSSLLVLCKQAVNNSVSAPQTVEEYENALALLDEYLELVDDIVMRNKREELSDRLTVMKEIEAVISEALTLYDNGQYQQAFSELSSAIEKYPDVHELNETYSLCTSSYIDYVTDSVKALCQEKKYDEALIMAEQAYAVHPCVEFSQLGEYVREESSFIYRFKKGFRDRFGNFF